MEIGKEVRQRKFRNEYHKATVNLIVTTNWLNEKLRTFFSSYSLTPQQFNILRILRGSGEALSTLQIRERMIDKMSDASRIVDRLVSKGLALKSVNRYDRRLVDVVISEKGLHLLEQIDSRMNDLDNLICKLTQQQAAQLNYMLDKIRDLED